MVMLMVMVVVVEVVVVKEGEAVMSNAINVRV